MANNNYLLSYTGTRIDYNAERYANSRQSMVEILRRRVRSFALHEIKLTSTGHQVVLASNQVLLAILVSIFPVDGTFAIKIVPFYFINYNENLARLSRKPRNLTSEQQLKTMKVLPLEIFYTYSISFLISN